MINIFVSYIFSIGSKTYFVQFHKNKTVAINYFVLSRFLVSPKLRLSRKKGKITNMINESEDNEQ